MLKFKCPVCSGEIDKMAFLFILKREYKCKKCKTAILSSTTLYITLFASIFIGLVLSNVLTYTVGRYLTVTQLLNLFAQIVTVLATWLVITMFFSKLGKAKIED